MILVNMCNMIDKWFYFGVIESIMRGFFVKNSVIPLNRVPCDKLALKDTQDFTALVCK